jgi:hypothetical protein
VGEFFWSMEYKIVQSTKYQVQSTRYEIRDWKYRMPNAEFWIKKWQFVDHPNLSCYLILATFLNVECRMPNFDWRIKTSNYPNAILGTLYFVLGTINSLITYEK